MSTGLEEILHLRIKQLETEMADGMKAADNWIRVLGQRLRWHEERERAIREVVDIYAHPMHPGECGYCAIRGIINSK